MGAIEARAAGAPPPWVVARRAAREETPLRQRGTSRPVAG